MTIREPIHHHGHAKKTCVTPGHVKSLGKTLSPAMMYNMIQYTLEYGNCGTPAEEGKFLYEALASSAQIFPRMGFNGVKNIWEITMEYDILEDMP